jgi:hypothetical protein
MVTTWVIQRRTATTDFSDLDTVNGEVFSYQDDSFEIETQYYYRVCKVIDGVSTDNWSNIASINIASTPIVGEITAESAASGSIVYSASLSATTAASSSVSGEIVCDYAIVGSATAQASLTGGLSIESGLDTLRIQRKILGGEWSDIATVIYSDGEYHDTYEDLSVGTTYYYRAIKENRSIHYGLGWSDEVNATYSGGETTLAGVINSISTVSDAQLSVSISMAGTVTAESTVSDASLSIERTLVGEVTAISNVSSIVDVDRIITGLIGASTALSGGIVLDLTLAATSTPISSVSGSLTVVEPVEVPLEGTTTAISNVSGSIVQDVGFHGTVTAQSDVSGYISVDYVIAGSITAESSLVGELVLGDIISLEGTIESQSSISANIVKTKRMMISTATIRNVKNQSVTHNFSSYIEDVES